MNFLLKWMNKVKCKEYFQILKYLYSIIIVFYCKYLNVNIKL